MVIHRWTISSFPLCYKHGEPEPKGECTIQTDRVTCKKCLELIQGGKV